MICDYEYLYVPNTAKVVNNVTNVIVKHDCTAVSLFFIVVSRYGERNNADVIFLRVLLQGPKRVSF